MKNFVGYLIDKGIKAIPRKKKVSPDIKSVKPTKDVKGSVKRAKSDAYIKNIDDLNKAQKKVREGKKMMKEGQKARKQMVGTKRAFQFKSSPSYHAIEPGDADKFKRNMKKPKPDKKFKTAKQMEKDERRKRDREPFMGGGMMGRRFGYSKGTPKPKTNVEKIKEAFGSKKGLKKIDPEKQKGLAKLKKARPDVVRKMGYFKRGGRS